MLIVGIRKMVVREMLLLCVITVEKLVVIALFLQIFNAGGLIKCLVSYSFLIHFKYEGISLFMSVMRVSPNIAIQV